VGDEKFESVQTSGSPAAGQAVLCSDRALPRRETTEGSAEPTVRIRSAAASRANFSRDLNAAHRRRINQTVGRPAVPEAERAEGLSPWRLQRRGDRLYGRSTADDKGQHTINFAALDPTLKTRGRLGFDIVYLVETGEEVGSRAIPLMLTGNQVCGDRAVRHLRVLVRSVLA